MVKHRLAFLIVLTASTPMAAWWGNEKWNDGIVTSWDGARIHYIASDVANAEKTTSENPRRSPSILFVPGYTMPAWIWEKQIEHFTANYRVVAMDLRSQ